MRDIRGLLFASDLQGKASIKQTAGVATYRLTIIGEVWQAPAESCPAVIVSTAVNRLQGRSLYKNKSPEELRPLRGVFLLSPGGVGQKEKKPFLSGSARKKGDLSKVALYPHHPESKITLQPYFLLRFIQAIIDNFFSEKRKKE